MGATSRRDQMRMWNRMARECAAGGEWLNERELDFVESMIRWTTSHMPTERQQAWLGNIHAKLGEHW
jgi:hypothetical protein